MTINIEQTYAHANKLRAIEIKLAALENQSRVKVGPNKSIKDGQLELIVNNNNKTFEFKGTNKIVINPNKRTIDDISIDSIITSITSDNSLTVDTSEQHKVNISIDSDFIDQYRKLDNRQWDEENNETFVITSELTDATDALNKSITANTEAINTLTTDLENLSTTVASNTESITANTEAIATNTESINDLNKTFETFDNDFSDLVSTVANKRDYSDLTTADGDTLAKVSTVQDLESQLYNKRDYDNLQYGDDDKLALESVVNGKRDKSDLNVYESDDVIIDKLATLEDLMPKRDYEDRTFIRHSEPDEAGEVQTFDDKLALESDLLELATIVTDKRDKDDRTFNVNDKLALESDVNNKRDKNDLTFDWQTEPDEDGNVQTINDKLVLLTQLATVNNALKLLVDNVRYKDDRTFKWTTEQNEVINDKLALESQVTVKRNYLDLSAIRFDKDGNPIEDSIALNSSLQTIAAVVDELNEKFAKQTESGTSWWEIVLNIAELGLTAADIAWTKAQLSTLIGTVQAQVAGLLKLHCADMARLTAAMNGWPDMPEIPDTGDAFDGFEEFDEVTNGADQIQQTKGMFDKMKDWFNDLFKNKRSVGDLEYQRLIDADSTGIGGANYPITFTDTIILSLDDELALAPLAEGQTTVKDQLALKSYVDDSCKNLATNANNAFASVNQTFNQLTAYIQEQFENFTPAVNNTYRDIEDLMVVSTYESGEAIQSYTRGITTTNYSTKPLLIECKFYCKELKRLNKFEVLISDETLNDWRGYENCYDICFEQYYIRLVNENTLDPSGNGYRIYCYDGADDERVETFEVLNAYTLVDDGYQTSKKYYYIDYLASNDYVNSCIEEYYNDCVQWRIDEKADKDYVNKELATKAIVNCKTFGEYREMPNRTDQLYHSITIGNPVRLITTYESWYRYDIRTTPIKVVYTVLIDSLLPYDSRTIEQFTTLNYRHNYRPEYSNDDYYSREVYNGDSIRLYKRRYPYSADVNANFEYEIGSIVYFNKDGTRNETFKIISVHDITLSSTANYANEREVVFDSLASLNDLNKVESRINELGNMIDWLSDKYFDDVINCYTNNLDHFLILLNDEEYIKLLTNEITFSKTIVAPNLLIGDSRLNVINELDSLHDVINEIRSRAIYSDSADIFKYLNLFSNDSNKTFEVTLDDNRIITLKNSLVKFDANVEIKRYLYMNSGGMNFIMKFDNKDAMDFSEGRCDIYGKLYVNSIMLNGEDLETRLANKEIWNTLDLWMLTDRTSMFEMKINDETFAWIDNTNFEFVRPIKFAAQTEVPLNVNYPALPANTKVGININSLLIRNWHDWWNTQWGSLTFDGSNDNVIQFTNWEIHLQRLTRIRDRLYINTPANSSEWFAAIHCMNNSLPTNYKYGMLFGKSENPEMMSYYYYYHDGTRGWVTQGLHSNDHIIRFNKERIELNRSTYAKAFNCDSLKFKTFGIQDNDDDEFKIYKNDNAIVRINNNGRIICKELDVNDWIYSSDLEVSNDTSLYNLEVVNKSVFNGSVEIRGSLTINGQAFSSSSSSGQTSISNELQLGNSDTKNFKLSYVPEGNSVSFQFAGSDAIMNLSRTGILLLNANCYILATMNITNAIVQSWKPIRVNTDDSNEIIHLFGNHDFASMLIGKSTNSNQSAFIGFSASGYYLSIGITGNGQTLKLYKDKIDANQKLTVYNTAQTNTSWQRTARFLSPNLQEGYYTDLYVGKNDILYESVYIAYKHPGLGSIGITGVVDLLTFTKDNISLNKETIVNKRLKINNDVVIKPALANTALTILTNTTLDDFALMWIGESLAADKCCNFGFTSDGLGTLGISGTNNVITFNKSNVWINKPLVVSTLRNTYGNIEYANVTNKLTVTNINNSLTFKGASEIVASGHLMSLHDSKPIKDRVDSYVTIDETIDLYTYNFSIDLLAKPYVISATQVDLTNVQIKMKVYLHDQISDDGDIYYSNLTNISDDATLGDYRLAYKSSTKQLWCERSGEKVIIMLSDIWIDELVKHSDIDLLLQYAGLGSNTITHYAPCDDELNVSLIGLPAFSSGSNVYYLNRVTNEWTVAKDINAPDVISKTTFRNKDCADRVGSWKSFLGICTKVDIAKRSIHFATHGDFIVRTNGQSFSIGDDIRFTDDFSDIVIIPDDEVITNKIKRLTIGTITGKINDSLYAVLKSS